MKVTTLSEIKGIGQALKEKLIEHYGSEEEALEAIRQGDVAGLSSIEGIGERFAVKIVRTLYMKEHNENIEDFLKTPDSVSLYEKVLAFIRQYANTNYARSKIVLLFPLPAKQLEKILSRQELMKRNFRLTKKVKDILPALDQQLRNIKPLKLRNFSIDVASRIILTTDESVATKLMKSSINQYCEVAFLDEPQQLSEYLEHYDEIIVLTDEIMYFDDVPNVISLNLSDAENIDALLPELNLAFFSHNKTVLEAMSKIAQLLLPYKDDPDLHDIIKGIDLETLASLSDILQNLREDGSPNVDMDSEYNRLYQAYHEIDELLVEEEAQVNERINEEIQNVSVELKGEKLLDLLKDHQMDLEEQFHNPRWQSILEESLATIFEEIVLEAIERVEKKLNLKPDESELLQTLFSREVVYPLEVNQEQRDKLLSYLRKKLAARAFELKSQLSAQLKPFKNLTITALKAFSELDFSLMIGKFILNFELSFPEIIPEKTGILVDALKNLELRQKELAGEITLQPVLYSIGEAGERPNIVGSERIVILSGANSGGKTTLLVGLAYLTILAQMGLAVPATKAKIGCFDELHFYRKAVGDTDAGAFEATLRRLASIVISNTTKLVLADEMESISEPGASAKVIAAFLELLHGTPNSCGLFVSHLAEDIAALCEAPIRIDGIEAKGLSDNLELIVDRTPKFNYFARSTPQLIVERLQKMSKDPERRIYQTILEKFKKSGVELESSSKDS